jgi:hypothetical protein
VTWGYVADEWHLERCLDCLETRRRYAYNLFMHPVRSESA